MYSSKFKDVIVLQDFNTTIEGACVENLFLSLLTYKILIKETKCLKNSNNPNYIDLILATKIRCSQNSCCIETGISDFHKMTVSPLKMKFHKMKLRVVSQWDLKHFQMKILYILSGLI